jgi:hypothetical protein
MNAVVYRRARQVALRGAATALLALISFSGTGAGALAQTAPPLLPLEPAAELPPGTPMVDADLPAVAPDGVPPLTGRGTLAVVPPAPQGTYSLVTADLGGGWLATAIVPADPTAPLAVTVAAADPAGVPGGAAPPTVVLSVQVYDTLTGSKAELPLTMAVVVPPGVDPYAVTVVQFDPMTGTYQAASVTVNERGVLIVQPS